MTKFYAQRFAVFLLFLLLGYVNLNAQNPFITVWQSDKFGDTSPNQIQIPASGDFTYTWEEVDATFTPISPVNQGSGSGSGMTTLTFTQSGYYRIELTPAGATPLHRINFSLTGDRNKLLAIEQWGDMQWSSFSNAMYQLYNVNISATDIPDLSVATDMSNGFRDCYNVTIANIANWDVNHITNMEGLFAGFSDFNSNISGWNVSGVTNMKEMFYNNFGSAFNQDLGTWDVGNVTNMKNMFYGCGEFNHNINSWTVNQVTNMEGMFFNCNAFDQPLNTWVVDNVTTMKEMFLGCYEFNQGLNSWDVGKVTDMRRMFSGCSKFNQDLSNWDVSMVTNMYGMFEYCEVFDGDITTWQVGAVKNMSNIFSNCSAFNQNIGGWNVSAVTNMSNMFKSCLIFNQDIGGWNVGSVNDMTAMFQYCLNFNQDLNDWNVSNVTYMYAMFNWATGFNSPVDRWDVSHVTDMDGIFLEAASFNQSLGDWTLSSLNGTLDIHGCNMNCTNYSKTLHGWANNPLSPPNISLDVYLPFLVDRGYSNDPIIVADRNFLINDLGWHIIGDVVGSCSVELEPFVTIWKTNNPGSSSNNQITVPATGDFNYIWDQLDINGNIIISQIIPQPASGTTTITFPGVGIYRLYMTGIGVSKFNRIEFNNGGDRLKLLSIEKWGAVAWSSLQNAFYGAENMKIEDIARPFLSYVTNASRAFSGTGIENVPNMNQWQVSTITDMSYMFADASLFNSNIGGWDVSNVNDMEGMFSDATSFDQSLGVWALSSLGGGKLTLSNSGMSCDNYGLSLYGWSINSATSPNITLEAVGVQYGIDIAFIDARTNLTSAPLSWTINDGGLGGCSDPLPAPYVTVWKTDNTHPWYEQSNADQIIIPAYGEYFYSWVELDIFGNPIHTNAGSGVGNGKKTITLPTPGTYELSLIPTGGNPFHRVRFINPPYGIPEDKLKLLEIKSWGSVKWSSFFEAFQSAENLISISASDVPDLSLVTDMSYAFHNAYSLAYAPQINNWDVSHVTNMRNMFSYAQLFNENIGGWNVSNVTDMTYMFNGASSFNQNIGSWYVGNVIEMSFMFAGASDFNQPIGGWTTDNVVNMDHMFEFAASFNQPINSWNTGKVTSMQGIFTNATSFDQPLSNWNVANVIDMSMMFLNAALFNQPINTWNVGKVENMNNMFSNAVTFNQPLYSWDVSKVYNFSGIFSFATDFNQSLEDWDLIACGPGTEGSLTSPFFGLDYSGLSCENYSRTLYGWANNPLTAFEMILFADDLEYSPDPVIVAARNFLDNNRIWDIYGDALGVCSVPLPIRLLKFTAFRQGDEAIVQWTSAAEYNFNGYVVEKMNINRTWEGQGFVSAQSLEKPNADKYHYSFIDHTPRPGINYYRLKQVDKDGSFTYSPIREVYFDKTGKISVFPNPTPGHVNVTGTDRYSVIRLMDYKGNIINTYRCDNNASQIDISQFTAGTYLVQIIDKEGTTITEKLVKQ